jgi:hypothetical protein
MKHSKITTLVFLLLSSICFSNNWEEFDNGTNEVKTKYIEISNSKFYKFKHVITVNISMEKLIEGIIDFPKYKDWYVDCKESKLIKLINENSGYIYSLNHTPWPYDNRDVVYKFENIKTEKTFVSKFTVANNIYPVDEDNFRIIDSSGSWELKKISPTKTTIEYIIYVNPGSTLPGGIANNTMGKTQAESLINFYKMLK